MKCIECNKGFCRKRYCWSNHVTYEGVPDQPKIGTKKRLPDEGDNNNTYSY